jgi:hypothetical protein
MLQQQKQMLGLIDRLAFAFKLDLALARSGLHAELMLQSLEIARVVVVKLLRETGAFKVQGFSGHGQSLATDDAEGVAGSKVTCDLDQPNCVR